MPDGSTVDPAVGTGTVRLPLDGGRTVTAGGAELRAAPAGLDGLLPAAVVA